MSFSAIQRTPQSHGSLARLQTKPLDEGVKPRLYLKQPNTNHQMLILKWEKFQEWILKRERCIASSRPRHQATLHARSSTRPLAINEGGDNGQQVRRV